MNCSFILYRSVNDKAQHRSARSIYGSYEGGKSTLMERPAIAQHKHSKTFRDFFADNKGQPLLAAIQCWNYKKKLPGHNRYEKADLMALD